MNRASRFHFTLFLLSCLFFVQSCKFVVNSTSSADPTDSEDLVDGVSSGQQRIFITSTTYDGNLGGLSGADDKCQTAAVSAGLTKTYKAFLSSSTTVAKSRFSLDLPLYEVSDSGVATRVADSLSDFQNGTVLSDPGFRYDENGDDQNALLATAATFWIATGAGSVNYCADWTSNSAMANGNIGSTNSGEIVGWGENSHCDLQLSIICVSDS